MKCIQLFDYLDSFRKLLGVIKNQIYKVEYQNKLQEVHP